MQDQSAQSDVFPFTLADLAFWVIKRKDGTTAKFVIGETKGGSSSVASTAANYTGGGTHLPEIATKSTSLSEYCHHTPTTPSFVGGDVALYVADSWGIRSMKNEFDIVIDCGDVFKVGEQTGILAGDRELTDALSSFSTRAKPTRFFQIDWDDRRAPDLEPEFWTRLSKLIRGDVAMNCQGGHGRSGTSFVCLLLNYAPEYTALDAITHLRAVHCPRAIESKLQHDYINTVAKYLGREANALEAEKVKDFKAAFQASKKKTALATKKMLLSLTHIKG